MNVVRVQKIGKTFVVTIPKDMAEDMGLDKFTEVKAVYDEEKKEVKYTKKKVG